ncbi:TNF receptor-associated factor 2-like [Ptychodera flava]|uniref:TNF receptor-associated factor 2-like n=1 Tax=Ptychodera flava TaxID=63121 RepID=UPI003969EC27
MDENLENSKPKPNGFSPQIFVKQPEEKYMCEACTYVLRKAAQSQCGHRYCDTCLKNLFRVPNTVCKACENEGCPNSYLEEGASFPDRAINRELGGREVKCINVDCPWKGIFRDYENNHENSCDFEIIPCDKEGCGTYTQRRNLENHQNTECLMRTVTCTHCKTEYPLKLLKSHRRECQEYPVECQFCRKITLPRRELTRHQDQERGDCPSKLVTCTFKPIGCNALTQEEKLEEHCKQNTITHQDLMCNCIVKFTADVEDAQKHRAALDGLEKQTKTHANQSRSYKGVYVNVKERCANRLTTIFTQIKKLQQIVKLIYFQ